jgi:hypothetical protein
MTNDAKLGQVKSAFQLPFLVCDFGTESFDRKALRHSSFV